MGTLFKAIRRWANSGPKYEFTGATQWLDDPGVRVRRIRALTNFGDVKAGDWGGMIQNRRNLGDAGLCWVDAHSTVCGNARVRGDALIVNSRLSGSAAAEDRASIVNTEMAGWEACGSPSIRIHGSAAITDSTLQVLHAAGRIIVGGPAIVESSQLTTAIADDDAALVSMVVNGDHVGIITSDIRATPAWIMPAAIHIDGAAHVKDAQPYWSRPATRKPIDYDRIFMAPITPR